MAASRDADWQRVSQLSNQGMTLFTSGHVARAITKLGDALGAARTLGEEDCLVAANLALHRLQCILYDAAPAAINAVHEEAYEQILPAVMQTLARRSAARTLLEGTVRPHELEWHRAHLAHLAFAIKGLARDEWDELAPHVGYNALVFAAGEALAHLTCRCRMPARGACKHPGVRQAHPARGAAHASC
jgi:hypothetical protein